MFISDAVSELQIPNGVTIMVSDGSVEVKGKNGTSVKKFSRKFLSVKSAGEKLMIEATSEKKLNKKAKLAEKAVTTEIKNAIDGVEKGIEKKLQIVTAHFPISLEVKGDRLMIKNIFGERYPRSAQIIGDTKVEVKGTDVKIRGVDPYDIGQTIANIKRTCYAGSHDSRVFQDGLYIVKEE